MGYATCFSNCFACGRLFGFNPTKVPALYGQPICKACIDYANPIRIKNGLDPIVPDPTAYEGIDERELPE